MIEQLEFKFVERELPWATPRSYAEIANEILDAVWNRDISSHMSPGSIREAFDEIARHQLTPDVMLMHPDTYRDMVDSLENVDE